MSAGLPKAPRLPVTTHDNLHLRITLKQVN